MKGILALLLLVTAAPPLVARTLEGEWTGDGPRTVFCEAGWGGIRVVASGESGISATVTLEARDESAAGTGAMKAGRLRMIEDGAEIRIFFEDPNESRAQGEPTGSLKNREYTATWALTVPPGFAVQAGLERGVVEIEGVAGGVHVEVGIGEVRLDVPEGGVHVELGEGKASVRLAREEAGDVTVCSQARKPELRVAGQRARWLVEDEAYTYKGDGPSEVQLETFSAEILVHLR